jgi:hypothetical protein
LIGSPPDRDLDDDVDVVRRIIPIEMASMRMGAPLGVEDALEKAPRYRRFSPFRRQQRRENLS